MKYDVHHVHKRKRVHHKLEKYPHKKKWVRVLDRLLLIVAVLGPLMSLPQIIRIYIGKNAVGVAPLSWLLYAVFDIPWIFYGVVHKEKPIVVGYTCWLVTNMLVVVGSLIYGAGFWII